MKTHNLAIVGATGAVGSEMISILEERKFPIGELRLLASAKSAGQRKTFQGKDIIIQELTKDSFKGIDIALFSAGGVVSQEYCPLAVKAGAVCVDNTSAFRMDPETPLVVPEVNLEALKDHKGIIANPNCSTIQMVLALKPIADALGLKRVVVSTYQAVAGAGAKGIQELEQQSVDIVAEREIESRIFSHQIAYNAIPHIDVFLENGFTKEEMKMILETKKILNDQDLQVTATTVRIPVMRSHSESVNIETKKFMPIEELKALLANSPGVTVLDDPFHNQYPMPIDVVGTDDAYVGRIRRDESVESGYHLWVVADNLRKGAALNTVQIAELLI
jgi:aspartate-semialdehyde dehydrogenase